jgi:hypothetical protein
MTTPALSEFTLFIDDLEGFHTALGSPTTVLDWEPDAPPQEGEWYVPIAADHYADQGMMLLNHNNPEDLEFGLNHIDLIQPGGPEYWRPISPNGGGNPTFVFDAPIRGFGFLSRGPLESHEWINFNLYLGEEKLGAWTWYPGNTSSAAFITDFEFDRVWRLTGNHTPIIFQSVPSPGAIALLGIAGLGTRRSRRRGVRRRLANAG